MKKIRKRKPFKNPFKYTMPTGQGEGFSADTVYNYADHPHKWWWAILKPVRGRFMFGFILVGISMTLSTGVSLILGRFVDDVYIGGNKDLVIPYALLVISIPLIRSIITVLYRYIYENASQNLTMRLRASLYRHLQELDTPYYDSNSVGDIMTKMTGDIDFVRHYTAYTLMNLIEQLAMFIAGIAIMLTLSWELTLASLTLVPFMVYLTNKFRTVVRPLWGMVRKQYSALNSVVQQNIGGNRVVRAFVRKDFETAKFEKENEEYRAINLKNAYLWVKYIPALEALSNMLAVPVILIGAFLVINGKMTIGELVAFNGILFIISNPAKIIGGLINEIQRFGISAIKLIELLMERPRVSSPEQDDGIADGETIVKFDHPIAVEFDSVSFRYSASKVHSPTRAVSWDTPAQYQAILAEDNALKGVTFKARRGEKIGIVGATGSGKTTLINLIMRYYDATTGTILINGKDIKSYQLSELRRHLGLVSQEIFLFSDTIEGNIAYGVPQTPVENVYESAKIAMADGFISAMPDGYDTIVGERGVGLSGGQRQRLSLARALCFGPDILILDDTTSAIDMETEFEIQNNLNKYFKDRTVFVVAHRISSVRYSDLILVLENGEIAESGTHEDLINKKGIYHDIYMTQSGLAFEHVSGEEVSVNGTK